MLKIGSWTVLLLLGLLIGCKSSEKPDYFGGITSDLDKLQNELEDGTYQIDSVTKSLIQFAAAEGDLRQPLSNVQTAIVDLDKTTAKIRSLGKDLDAKEAAYKSSWSKDIESIENANVRKTAEQGRAEVDADFNRLQQQSDALGNRYREWESKVKQIESSLKADLSPNNQKVQAAKIKEVEDLAPRLKDDIRNLRTSIGSISTSLKSAR